ncbi:hypothetical protein ACQKMK_16025 [Viridibacillus arvi]|uniref:hypothetical protein n=1 Tax=Viridibacillus arvi TaxID=263475 RepID=UPI003CFF5B8D
MLKGLPLYMVLIAVGSLSITFGMTRNLPLTMQWILLISGTILNIISLIGLFIFLAKQDSNEKA